MPLYHVLICFFGITLAAAVLADDRPGHSGAGWTPGTHPPAQSASQPPLTTVAERSNWAQTGTYDEVTHLCHAFAARYPKEVHCVKLGETPQHRPIWTMIVTGTGVFSPAEAKVRNIPVVLMQGGIHAGEIDGKDAGFLALRQLLDGKVDESAALKKLIFVFTPVFNVDGHEMRGPFNRPNQSGPAEQGQRMSAQRLNLNRQYMIADAPEMQAMLRTLNQWDPVLYVDLHVTDGSQYQYEVASGTAPVKYGLPEVIALAKEINDKLHKELKERGDKPAPFYVSLVDPDDPSKGFLNDTGVDSGRYSEAYWGLRNRVGVLIEDHSWKDYPTRIRVCRDTVLSLLHIVGDMGEKLLKVSHDADQQGSELGGTPVTLEWDNPTDPKQGATSKIVPFDGYRFERKEHDPITGGQSLTYHLDQPTTLSLPYYEDLVPVPGSTVTLPKGGYLVPAQYVSEVLPRLKLHDLRYRILKQPRNEQVQAMRVDPESVLFDRRPFQNRQMAHVKGTWVQETRTMPAGSIFVPIDQPKGLLVAHLFEPAAPDSFSSWGVFNSAYEWGDSMSDFRSDQIIDWMYHGDPRIRKLYGEELWKELPELRRQFDEKVKTDPAFAADSDKRAGFWTDHIPPLDGNLGLYPVFRTDSHFP